MRKLRQGLRRGLARLQPSSSRVVPEHKAASTSALTTSRDPSIDQDLRPVSAHEAITPFAGCSLQPQPLAPPRSRVPTGGDGQDPSVLTAPGSPPAIVVSDLLVPPSEHPVVIATTTPTVLHAQDPSQPQDPALLPRPSQHVPDAVILTPSASLPSPSGPLQTPSGPPSSRSVFPPALPMLSLVIHAPGSALSLSTSGPVVSTNLDKTISKPQENHTPTIPLPSNAKPSEPSVWEQAFNKLSDRDKQAFPFTDADKRDYIGEILEVTKKSRDICQEGRLKFTVWNKDIIVRDVADKLLTWVDKFKSIGDCAVQYDPVHAALPWAGVRFLLQIAINSKETMEVVLIGVERIARPLVRCAIYEGLYLGSGVGLSAHKNLEGALEEFYSTVLGFLAFAKRYLDKPSPSSYPVYLITRSVATLFGL